jgi:hypothetical protein
MSNLEQLIIDLKLSMERRMDGLQEQIAGVDQRAEERTAGLDQRLQGQIRDVASKTESLEHLVLDLKESLERQIVTSEEATRKELHEAVVEFRARYDNQSGRLDRHAALWQTGRRWSAKMDDWAQKMERDSRR